MKKKEISDNQRFLPLPKHIVEASLRMEAKRPLANAQYPQKSAKVELPEEHSETPVVFTLKTVMPLTPWYRRILPALVSLFR